jgi:hypothetical protein
LEYQTCRVRFRFNRVIELNLKMLILKDLLQKVLFYVMMTTEMFIDYFCNIKLCFPHLKSLIFDCLSLTEGLITCLSTVDSEAPAASKTAVTSLCLMTTISVIY